MNLLAQLRNPVLPDKIGGGTNPDYTTGGTAIGGFISSIIGGMMAIGFILTLLYLLTGAFHWITSGGDKANLENARNKITHAIVGLIILASVWAVMILVGQFIGLDFTKLPIPSIGNP